MPQSESAFGSYYTLESGVADFPGLAYLETHSRIRFDDNFVVLLNNKDELVGTRIKVPLLSTLRHLSHRSSIGEEVCVICDVGLKRHKCILRLYGAFVVCQWTSTYCQGVVIRSATCGCCSFHLSLFHVRYNGV